MPILGVLSSEGLAPGAPTIGTATAGNAQATVTYTAPAWTGKGSGAVTYTATSSPGGLTGTGSSPITVSGLTNGTAYTFTVKATTSYGATGAASAASNSVTPTAPAVKFMSPTGSYINYSSDGTSWTVLLTGGGGQYAGYDGTYFIKQDDTSGAYASTVSGTWTTFSHTTQSTNRYGWSGGGKSVLVGYTGKYSYAGSPPSSWTNNQNFSQNGDWFGGKYANGRHIATQLNDGGATSQYAAYSSDAVSWSVVTVGANQNWRGPAYGNGRWIISPRSSSTYSYSTNNGSIWSTGTLPASADYMIPVYGNGIWVMPVMGSTTLITSTNGTSWTTRSLPNTSNGSDGATPTYGGGLFIVPGSNLKEYFYSSDGISWSTGNMQTNSSFKYYIVDTDGGIGS